MVEIPDYLLERSREARARLSGAPPGDSQSDATETAVVAAAESAPAEPVSTPDRQLRSYAADCNRHSP